MKKNIIIYEVSEEELISNRAKNIIDYLNKIERNEKRSCASLVIKFSKVNSVLEATMNINEKKDDFIRKVYNNFIELFYFLSDEKQKINIFHSILRVKLYSDTTSHINYKIKILRERIKRDTLNYGGKINDMEGARKSITFLNKITLKQKGR